MVNHAISPARFISLFVILLAGCFVLPAGAKAEGEPAAVLAVVAGSVQVHRGEAVVDGSFGASLQEGDVVETGADAEAAVLFASGQLIELGPGSRISIGAMPAAGAGSELAQAADALSGKIDRFARDPGEGLSALPNLRSSTNDDRPHPISPRNTLVSPYPVRFTWTPVEDALEYRVVFSGPDGATQDHATSETYLDEPEGVGWFSGASRWSWRVEAVTPDGPVASDEVSFEFAPKERWMEFEAVGERLGPLTRSENAVQADAALYLLGSFAKKAGFYSDAIEEFETLVSRHPHRKELHHELGTLYQAVGRNDKAAEAYRLALRE